MDQQIGTEFSKVHAKIDLARAELNTKIDLVHAELSSKMETGFARIEAKVERSNTMLLKWMFGSQISVAAIFIAAIKYL
jgi:dihydroxyacetone kinase DhaKLM complex PTS-EIIA-like component DhaM